MYIKLPDIYPYDLNSQFQLDFPNTSKQDVWNESALAELGIFPVVMVEQPDFVMHEQSVTELAPQQINGVWTQVWSVVERTPEDKQNLTEARASAIRSERDRRLREECDRINPMWWQDMTEEQKLGMKAYRQALLDVPSQPGFPWSVEWPANPL